MRDDELIEDFEIQTCASVLCRILKEHGQAEIREFASSLWNGRITKGTVSQERIADVLRLWGAHKVKTEPQLEKGSEF